MNEIWKTIEINTKYSVSNLGRVKNNKTNRILKPWDSNGYLKVKINKKKKYYIHRLVATSFLTNLKNLPIVNHINGVRSDNNIKNLEWVTYKMNSIHSKQTLESSITYKKISSIFEENKNLTNIELIELLLSNCS